jgi:outer membrane lipoprotein-sorting protein
MHFRPSRLAVFFAAIALTATASAQTKPAIIAQLNAASAKFTSAQADLRQELFTKVVQDTEVQAGQIYFLRKSGTIQMGLKMYPPDAKPGAPPAQIVEFKDGKLQMLNTGTHQVDVFSATGKNQALADTLMTVGFGATGTDLEKAWNITDQGPETLKDGNQSVQAEKLDLVSKDAGIRNTFSHITIWVDPVRDVSLKQVSYEASGGKPTGDTRTVYYSNIRLNQPVDTTPFAIKCPGKCTVVQH